MATTKHILGRVEGVQREGNTEGSRVEAQSVELAHQFEGLFARLHVAYLLQIRHNGLVTHLIAGHAVHIEAIEGANLLTVGALRQILLACILRDEVVDAVVVLLVEIGKRTILGVNLIEGVGLQPSTYGILPEIITGFYTGIHVGFKILCGACQTYKGKGHCKK